MLALLLTSNANAQKCRYIKDFKDPFTNELAQVAIGNPFAAKEVIFQLRNGKLYLGLSIVFSDLGSMSFKKEDKISFKLANGEVIEISPETDVEPRCFMIGNIKAQQWAVAQEVSKEVFEKMTTSPIVAVKYRLINEYLITEKEIKDRQVNKIMENVSCMLTLLN